MLILSRKLNESIVIDGRISVKVVRVDGDIVKLGITAPAEVPVHRQEVYDEIRKSNREALTQGSGQVPKLALGQAPVKAPALKPLAGAPAQPEKTAKV
jgi:carbon storage regulator